MNCYTWPCSLHQSKTIRDKVAWTLLIWLRILTAIEKIAIVCLDSLNRGLNNLWNLPKMPICKSKMILIEFHSCLSINLSWHLISWMLISKVWLSIWDRSISRKLRKYLRSKNVSLNFLEIQWTLNIKEWWKKGSSNRILRRIDNMLKSTSLRFLDRSVCYTLMLP